MTELSPAAEAVLDAYWKADPESTEHPDAYEVAGIAAALRAVADQCINRAWSVEMDDLYRELYAIAAELESQ